eukprot:TRINITY_DN14912_c0_g1_i1.p1 TRINITY_DN14912_c0_g1~~TRINITY_DN14912_c0_g1_i1.p1  ORF type:complete len:203 (-),score=48.63 TRINITY_DN14912_c0_g1_i1:40-648(-)
MGRTEDASASSSDEVTTPVPASDIEALRREIQMLREQVNTLDAIVRSFLPRHVETRVLQHGEEIREGDKFEAFWRVQWYKATALQVDGRFIKIRYDGWDSNYDEWVTKDKIRVIGSEEKHPSEGPKEKQEKEEKAGNEPVFESININLLKVGDQIEVYWVSTWYPATVLEIKEGLCKIRYNSYDASYDEWVNSPRIRVRKQW